MNKKIIQLSVAVVGILSVSILYQNCAKTSFASSSASEASGGSSTTSSDDANSNGNSSSSENSVGNVINKLEICPDASCLQAGSQKILFTNEVGVALRILEVRRDGDRDLTVHVENFLNQVSGRNLQLRMKMMANGYVMPMPVPGQKPALCFDQAQAIDAQINGEPNCMSQVEIFGEKQARVSFGASIRQIDSASTISGRLGISSECPDRNCLRLPNSKKRLVFQDLANSDFGVMVESKSVLSDGRTKMSMIDVEGRKLTFLVKDPDDGFNILNAITLFDQRDLGYFCFDPKKPGLALVNSSGRLKVNCFSSLRYSILPESGSAGLSSFPSGSIQFIGLDINPVNYRIIAPSDTELFFKSGIIPESLQFN